MRHMKKNRWGDLGKAALIGAFLTLSSVSAYASEVSEKEIRVAVRAFGFAYNLPKGDLEIEIIYDHDNPKSHEEAQKLTEFLSGGFKVGSRRLTGKMLPVEEMGTTGNKIVFITNGMGQKYGKVFERASQHNQLTFTTDFGCVMAQKCVMGISATPNIKIEVSRTATEASKLEFSQALKLMIREVE